MFVSRLYIGGRARQHCGDARGGFRRGSWDYLAIVRIRIFGIRGLSGLCGMVGIFAKFLSFPLISVRLSRAVRRDLGVNGGGLSRFWG